MWKQEIQYYACLDSTNLEAGRQARNRAPEGTVIVAGEQTAGRGRRGRTWNSPAGGNLYFSLVLRPRVAIEVVPSLTLLMGLAVAEAIGEASVKIKWPNDIVIDGRKVCGILAEMLLPEEGGAPSVIIGVGVNVRAREFPEEIRETAISLEEIYGAESLHADVLSGGAADGREEELLHRILDIFKKYYDTFCEKGGFDTFVERYNARLVNCNSQVAVIEPGEGTYRGVAMGVNARGELLVQREDGSVNCVTAGEVSVRGIYGYV